MIRPLDLISPNYRDLQMQLHAAPRGYGGRGDKWAGVVMQIAKEYEASSILDYGCGQGTLVACLKAGPFSSGIRFNEYDPAIPGKDTIPDFADLVVCTDVLEHIEPDRLDVVLRHLRMLARKAVWVVISTKHSNKILRDGRNAHLTIQSSKWWRQKVRVAGFTPHPPPTIVRLIPEKEWCAVLTP